MYVKGTNDKNLKLYTLLDNGSSLTVINPDKLEELTKKKLLKTRVINSKSFYVENGSKNDVEYTGRNIILQIQKPGTKDYIDIQTFIMPHNRCRYDLILGQKDAEKLGYKMYLRIGNKMIYKHKGKVNQLEVLGDSALADGWKYFNDHKIDLKNQQILMNEKDEEKESKSDEEQKTEKESKYHSNDDVKDENYYNHIEEETDQIDERHTDEHQS